MYVFAFMCLHDLQEVTTATPNKNELSHVAVRILPDHARMCDMVPRNRITVILLGLIPINWMGWSQCLNRGPIYHSASPRYLLHTSFNAVDQRPADLLLYLLVYN